LALLAAGCSDGVRAADARGVRMKPLALEFVDVAQAAGVDVVQVSGDPRRWYIVESNGCGAAWLDYDGDGDPDLFVSNGQGLRYVDDGARLERVKSGASRLYRNDTPAGGRATFADVTEISGAKRDDWINAAATGDVDNDGDPDLYLACFGKDVLLVNEKRTFTDGTDAAGLGCDLWGAGASFGDADNDGDLDLYVANYCLFDLESPPAGGKRHVIEGVEVAFGPEAENKRGINPGAPDRYYVNDGRGRFRDATKAAGLELPAALCSYAAVFSDVNADGWQDILVANDMQPCNLFVNQGRGQFRDEAKERGFARNADGFATAAMGLAVEDVDRDGDLDVFRTNFDFEANSLHRNEGQGQFRDVAAAVGLAEPSLDKLGWACAFLDAELDGDLDLLVANGHVYPQASQIGMHPWAQVTQLFEATGDPRAPNWREVRPSEAGAGLVPKKSARGIALADFDRDGDQDAVVTDMDAAPRLLENRSGGAGGRGHWLSVALVGSASNREGQGARLEARAGEATWTRELRTVSGLYSSHEARAHFGLGSVRELDCVRVRWPSGRVSELVRVPTDQFLTIEEPPPVDR
jgi:hypothetical protein